MQREKWFRIESSGRNLNIDVFRCLLMFLIVLNHAFIRGEWSYNQKLWALPFSCLIAWHVDGFVAISGWFGIKFSWRKFFRLWALMAWYTVINAIIGRVVFDIPITANSLVVSGGWFGGTYLALMLASPFLNAGVCAIINDYGFKVWILLAAMVTFNWAPAKLMSAVSISGGGQFSLITLAFVYVTARVLKTKLQVIIPLKRLMLGPGLFLLTVFAIGVGKSLLDMGRGSNDHFVAASFDWLTYYDGPHVWIMAMSLLMIFEWHLKIPRWLGGVCSTLRPSIFPVYLIHESAWGRQFMLESQRVLSDRLNWHPAILILLCAIAVFVYCIVLDLPRRLVLRLCRT